MQFTISDKESYLLPFSHNTSVTHEQTGNNRVIDALYSIAVQRQKAIKDLKFPPRIIKYCCHVVNISNSI